MAQVYQIQKWWRLILLQSLRDWFSLPIVGKIINEHAGDFLIKNKKEKMELKLKFHSLELMHKDILVIDDNPDIIFNLQYFKRAKF